MPPRCRCWQYRWRARCGSCRFALGGRRFWALRRRWRGWLPRWPSPPVWLGTERCGRRIRRKRRHPCLRQREALGRLGSRFARRRLRIISGCRPARPHPNRCGRAGRGCRLRWQGGGWQAGFAAAPRQPGFRAKAQKAGCFQGRCRAGCRLRRGCSRSWRAPFGVGKSVFQAA